MHHNSPSLLWAPVVAPWHIIFTLYSLPAYFNKTTVFTPVAIPSYWPRLFLVSANPTGPYKEMPPLTSPSGCDSCLCLTQKISELEGKIAVLYQIKDDEQLLDSLVTTGPAFTSSTAGEMVLTVPCLNLSATQPPNHWFKLGAKPKAPATSTPSQKEPWTTAHRGKHSRKLLSCLHPPQAL